MNDLPSPDTCEITALHRQVEALSNESTDGAITMMWLLMLRSILTSTQSQLSRNYFLSLMCLPWREIDTTN
ncbi:unnamed protein product [Auanema sp. JU1783]|nr:unnamed protein product [Auanema sp. JU1783]